MRAFKTVLLLLLWVVAITARAELSFPAPVSYTHLTLPTNREV